MQVQINRTTNTRLAGRAARNVRLCIALAAAFIGWQAAYAKPGGEPLVLDTQTGIHSGVSGTVLQSGPLGGPGMVPMATLPGIQQADPPIVVSPYVEYSSGQGAAPSQPSQPGQPRGTRPRVSRTPHP
ncbi:hypothetical protein AWB77_06761 [Caballeronia fortuita]|uniref:Uncharacterized protein n=1 Tax=Caballeronia fortuita TaxID=1777138 RepID=A0A158E989_9BURK|nr:hypothetical protein [Caballeronia fortuita]SAL03323.1 hypothetical protein AWB77_06761 [Caballeronia fortuita]